MILSGEVQEPFTNVFIGATNLSEFALAAGLPTGMTGAGLDNASAPDTFAVANDMAEGNYFSYSGQAAFQAGAAFSFDAFDGDFWPSDPQIEILARVFIGPTTRANHYGLGVGFTFEGNLLAELDVTGAIVLKTTGPNLLTAIGGMTNGSGGTFGASGNMQGAEALGTWAWLRVRSQKNAGMVNWDHRAKLWHGALAAEPVAWDTESINVGRAGNVAGIRMGVFSMQSITPGNDVDEQRVSFFSWTTDWAQAPAPTPDEVLEAGDILPPDVTVDPLQGTWIGVRGTPFTLVT